tara:strand:+ start:42860 stop:44917 length:2058 start_codon:yes stop_codon:yes gene_type:complete
MISLTSFNLFISHFHFVRPYWLLAILALLPILWRLKKHRFYQSPWQQFLPSHLSQVLIEGSSSTNVNKKSITEHAFLFKPFIIGLLSIIALAGPVWKKLPQPVYQTERGSVLIMDMSYSMYATDVKPNRLTRARFKAIDLLKRINEGDIGLIAYAGSAFVISPLTQDIKNIELLLPSLTPEIMPELGANPVAALTLAHEMLLNAGHLTGDIYWFTDDVDNEEIADIYEWSTKFGHQLNILGIGSESGAPITLPSGELLKDNSGAIVVPRLPSQKLKSLASRGHGNYQTIKNDDSDISNLIIKDEIAQINQDKKQQNQQTGDQWQEQGAWLLLLVLPLMISYFRRGSTLLMLPLSYIPLLFSLSYSLVSPASFAAESTDKKVTEQESKPLNQQENTQNTSKPSTAETLTSTSKTIWQNLWQTNDQQAQEQYNQEHYQDAAKQFENSQWQGSSYYKAGNYQEALDAFKKGKKANSANSLYNQGNALAQMKEYDQAIESYEKALDKNPELQDAKDNIEKIKQLQKEQEKNKEQQQGDKSKEDQSQDSQPQDSQPQDKQSKEQQNQQKSDDSQKQKKDSPGEQPENDKQKESEPQDSSKKQKDKEAEKKQQKPQEQKSAEQTEKQDKQGEKKTAAQIAAEQQAKETEQKHQQLLNKVTDDPYLLLRNKMQLEYQKRKQDGASRGVKKKW